MNNTALAKKFIVEMKSSKKYPHGDEVLARAIFHDLKRWPAEEGSAGKKYQTALLASLQHLYTGIELSNAPCELTFDWTIQEWVCAKTGDYGFGLIKNKKNEVYKPDLAPINPEKGVKVTKRNEVNPIDAALTNILPCAKQPITFITNREIEVARRIKNELHKFWNPTPSISILGTEQLHGQFINTVLELLTIDSHPFHNATNGNGLATYLYLFQCIELDNAYSKEVCANWAFHLTEVHQKVEGASDIYSIFWMEKMQQINSKLKSSIDTFEQLVKDINKQDVCGDYKAIKGGYSISLWQYPNKESTTLELILKESHVTIKCSSSHVNEYSNIEEAKQALMNHFCNS